jgi:uncharacterized membrane protein
LLLVAAGAAVRHALNLRFTWRPWKPALATTLAASVGAIYAVLAIPAGPEAPRADPSGVPATVTFADVRHVIDRRCAACHSAEPSDVSFGVAPAGVSFDTPAQIAARAARINERAVVTRTMPPGNKTRITDAERAVLARWIAQGAPVR